MKHLLTVLLSLISIAPIFSQCPDETIVLMTQSDVDNFALDYPGCTYLETNLFIGTDKFIPTTPNCTDAVDPIVNLSGLDQLTYLDSLVIQCNNSLQLIDGLNGLDSVDNIYISWNEELTDILGFGKLTKVSGFLDILNNDKLNNVLGFSNLQSSRLVNIRANGQVDFKHLKDGFSTVLIGNIEILHMDSISSLNLSVTDNDIIENFDFFSGRELDVLNVSMNDISQPLSFEGLELQKVASISIRGANDVDFTQLESISNIALRLQDCENCNNLRGLENLKFYGFHLSNLPQLTSLEDLGETRGALFSLIIDNCEQLENIDALSGISSIDWWLAIINNASLDNCSIKPICRAVTDLTFVSIENNGPSNTCNTADQIVIGCVEKETYIDFTICDGDTITLNNIDYTSVGLYYQDLVNQQGLDSVLVIDIIEADDCPDPNENPDTCPLDSTRPGLQINKLSTDLYNVIISYKESNMTLSEIEFSAIIEIISCHKVCRDLTFDITSFSFLDYCDRIDEISRGQSFDVPEIGDVDLMKYSTMIGEITYFSEFIIEMSIEECVKL